jgi:hypothetical protein
MIQKLKNLLFPYKYTVTPKGISFMRYLENDINGVKQEPIEAYDKTIEKLCNAIKSE